VIREEQPARTKQINHQDARNTRSLSSTESRGLVPLVSWWFTSFLQRKERHHT